MHTQPPLMRSGRDSKRPPMSNTDTETDDDADEELAALREQTTHGDR